MRTTIEFIIFLVLLTIGVLWVKDTFTPSQFTEDIPGKEGCRDAPTFTFDDLLDAIAWVESKGGRKIYGDYQIAKDYELEAGGIYPLRETGEGYCPIYFDPEKNAYYKADAVGDFQLHKIYVDDVNRIMQHWGWDESYTYADRLDKKMSRRMVRNYISYWTEFALSKYLLTHWADRELEITDEMQFKYAAKIHNGGPDGWKKESTEPYWQKVKARMESQRKIGLGK
jgi:hypothetical protein